MIYARWYNQENNWGDALNPYLISKISGQEIKYIKGPGLDKYLCIGSIMHYADRSCTIWGTGCISSKAAPVEKPKKICAVRGPLTRKRLLDLGYECPEIYGDPALLLPRYLKITPKPTHNLGVVCHYMDKDNDWIKKHANNKNIKIIDVQGGVEQFAKDIISCKSIVSSSLHGIICGDAYGIPSYWAEFSNKVVGGGFKFKDYFLSVNRPIVESIKLFDKNAILNGSPQFCDYKIDIDLDQLMDACPFNSFNK